jgi:hypothetical protein
MQLITFSAQNFLMKNVKIRHKVGLFFLITLETLLLCQLYAGAIGPGQQKISAE